MTQRLLAIIAFVASLMPHVALAWGQEGHSIVAELAQRQIAPQTQSRITSLLGSNASLASISTWADTVARSTHTETYGFHFVDIPLNSPTYSTPTPLDPGARDDCHFQKGGVRYADTCVVKAIAKYLEELKAFRAKAAPTTADLIQAREALAFLVHFVGDVHQPLHTVDDNIGENLLTVTVLLSLPAMQTVTTNLHYIWDTALFADDFSWGASFNTITTAYFGTTTLGTIDFPSGSSPPLVENCDVPPPVTGSPQSAVWEAIAACWANESHAIARQPGLVVANGAFLDRQYFRQMRGIRDVQMLRAGRRLSQLLDRIFSQ
jgi:hypothetical protein